MFKNLRIVLVSLVLLLLPVSASEITTTSAPADKVTIQLVHTNDMHGNIGGAGQLLNLSTWIKNFKKDNPNTFVIDAGDAIQGTPVVNKTKGNLMIDVMNSVGYDMVTLGNHEFDFGKSALEANLKNYDASVLQANIKDAKTGKYLYKRYEIKEVQGKKIGFFGLIGVDAGVKSDPEIMRSYKIEDPIKVGKEMVAFLQSKKVDVIVAITHLGVSDEGFSNSKDLSANVPGINVIIDGHSHTACPSSSCKNEGVALISQNDGGFSNGARYVTITIEKDRKTFTSTKITPNQLKAVAQDPAAKAIFDKENDVFKVYGSEVIGSAAVELNGARSKDNPYNNVRSYEMNSGNLIADAYLAAGKTDLAVINGGNIRIPVPAGVINRTTILTLQPFANAIVVAELTGEKILSVFEKSVANFPNEFGGFLHLAGGSFKFDSTKPAGSRITEFLIGGVALDVKKVYSISIPDFTLKGGDGFTMLVGTPYTRTLAKVDSEIVMDYIQAQKTVSPKIEGRIVDIARK